MIVIKSSLLSRYPEITFGFSTKRAIETKPPFYFNLSLSVGDDEQRVHFNRKMFCDFLGVQEIVFQKQIHSSIVTYVNSPGICGESDAMITDKHGLGLAISVADCTPIFLYDRHNRVVAGIHSGWRGTQQKIVEKTLAKLSEDFNTKPEHLVIYVGPSITGNNYEVGEEVACQFDPKYLKKRGTKYLLDVRKANYDMLITWGIIPGNIQMSNLCTYELKELMHSYRRDGQVSGRLLGIIALK